LLISCKEKEEKKQILAEQNKKIKKQVKELHSKIEELSSNYNVVVDWWKKFDLKTKPFGETLYTIQIQDVFFKEKKQCYLFFVAISDIKKVNNKYILIADEFYPIDWRRNVYIHLRLNCDREKVDTILKQKPSSVDRYAIFVTIKSIEKPALNIRPDIEYDLLAENNTFAETHPDDIDDFLEIKITGENYNSFIATGKCLDLLFVGKDDWMDDPTNYERFLEVFDINQP